jgi:hypothetical protein
VGRLDGALAKGSAADIPPAYGRVPQGRPPPRQPVDHGGAKKHRTLSDLDEALAARWYADGKRVLGIETLLRQGIQADDAETSKTRNRLRDTRLIQQRALGVRIFIRLAALSSMRTAFSSNVPALRAITGCCRHYRQSNRPG